MDHDRCLCHSTSRFVHCHQFAATRGKYPLFRFWNEIYETVLAPYILDPTALFGVRSIPNWVSSMSQQRPASSRIDISTRRSRDPKESCCCRIILGSRWRPGDFFVHNADHKGAVLMNVFWIIFNCIILGTANAVAVEAQQRRGSVRLSRRMIVSIRTLSGAACV